MSLTENPFVEGLVGELVGMTERTSLEGLAGGLQVELSFELDDGMIKV